MSANQHVTGSVPANCNQIESDVRSRIPKFRDSRELTDSQFLLTERNDIRWRDIRTKICQPLKELINEEMIELVVVNVPDGSKYEWIHGSRLICSRVGSQSNNERVKESCEVDVRYGKSQIHWFISDYDRKLHETSGNRLYEVAIRKDGDYVSFSTVSLFVSFAKKFIVRDLLLDGKQRNIRNVYHSLRINWRDGRIKRRIAIAIATAAITTVRMLCNRDRVF